ncbi:MAG: RagB/SusD family nutrient uptake outer membrane protein [Chitinophagaceae bacterium]|nr:RagB/SusD family nutrient uptake outer membrane protein [Chitinophagaceae bacterium]
MKYIRYVCLLLSVSLLGGCAKNLDQYPLDKVSVPTFWKSQSDADLALMGCYHASQYFAYDYWYFDGASDNIICQYPWESSATNISMGAINAELVNGIFGDYNYQYINRFNTLIENIDNVSMGDALKKQHKAEARFLRAFNYFLLTGMFGDVPLVTSTDKAAINLAPEKEEVITNFIVAELDLAIPDLPEIAADISRVSKGAALALKARVQLYYNKWTEAAATAQTIMNMNYSLFKVSSLSAGDYDDDYSTFVTFADNAARERFYKGLRSYQKMYYKAVESANPELIWVTQYQAIANYQYSQEKTNGMNTLCLPPALGGWSSLAPTQSLVDAYWMWDGSKTPVLNAATRAENFDFPNNPKPAYYNEFKNRDPRLYASIFFPGNFWKEYNASYVHSWQSGGGDNSPSGYDMRKLVDPAYNEFPEFVGGQSFPLFRYAEVLLTYAEAKNEADGPDVSIYNALNEIRDRAGMPSVDQATYNTKEKLRDLIRNERRIELAGEGQRYFDIRRWNIAEDVMKTEISISNEVAQTRVWQSKFVKLPYPQSAIDNNELLKDAQEKKGY